MSMAADIDKQIDDLQRHLAVLDQERAATTAKLRELRVLRDEREPGLEPAEPPGSTTKVDSNSPAADKIALFKSLFRGREDVFPRRWENSKTGKSGYAPACGNEWVRGVCEKPRIKCGECPRQAFIPVTDATVVSHLQGRDRISGRQTSDIFVAGVYPMLPNETCWFLSADFDKKFWARDARAFVETCRDRNVPAVLERSRSGNGGHVWIFFSEPIPAGEARRLGSLLLTETMERCPDIGFASYDRFFPSQDTMPVGGFGNLIALPLQQRPRENGNSVFVDDDLRPYDDQWAFLSTIRKMTRCEVTALTEEAANAGRILGVRLPLDDDDEPWTAPPSRHRSNAPISGELPARLVITLGNQAYIDRSSLPPAFVNALIRLSAFQNPEFYAAQSMRLPTFGKPRIISCAELFPKHVGLPRGSLEDVVSLCSAHGIGVELRDERQEGATLETRFLGTLTSEQAAAACAILEHDTGVLAATTAFGKTVVAAHLIAARGCNTLVLVHRQQLLDQWVARLRAFLSIDPKRVGVIGGGKRRSTGFIDVALIQSLVRKGEVSDIVADYGHVIIDECHHLSAVSFEAVTRRAKAKYFLGLSATVTRKDGHHPIIFMQCGPIRHRVDARKQAAQSPFTHRVILRQTTFQIPTREPKERRAIQELYSALAEDKPRNDLIFDDILSALEAGRSPVVITERKDHLSALADRLSRFARNVIVLRGGMGSRAREAVRKALADVPDDQERLLVATGRYLGEGFDDARLDTLFLTMPISWRGTLAQYVGRLHRSHDAKQAVVVYDYVDAQDPMLAKMAAKRQAGYRSLGYEVNASDDPQASNLL